MSAVGARLVYEGGIVVAQTRSKTRANTDGAGITVLGDFITGGASSSATDFSRTRWTSKHVVRSSASRPWSVGITLAGTDHSSRQTINVAGTFQFADSQAYASALAGGSTATWFVTRGNGAVRYANVTAAPFLQKAVVRTEHVELLAGGVMLRELRLSDAASLHRMLTSAEASRFISPPPATVAGFERFIAWTLAERAAGRYVCFAVVPAGTDSAVGLFQIRQLDPGFEVAEWGFAIGVEFWGSGLFATAAPAIVDFAIDRLGVRRLEARSAAANGAATAPCRRSARRARHISGGRS
jgi:RimJ/RimL family protein N-acetyltransferase